MDNETEIWAPGRKGGRNVSVLTCVICDELVRRTVTVPVTPSRAGAQLASRAFTVWTALGDNLFLHRAFDAAKSGDVLVVNGSGDTTRALIGNLTRNPTKMLGFVQVPDNAQ